MSKTRTAGTNQLDRRALFQAEHGPVAGPPDAGASWRVALIYPNTYHIGMSSLGFQITAQVLQRAGARVERFFTDTLEQGSIESSAPLQNFDIIAFSGAYEMDDAHVPDLLARAGLPFLAHQRTAGRAWPLVVMGGVLVAVNRLPLYPFIDLFCHGEAELIWPALLGRLEEVHAQKLGRGELLLALAETPGVELTAGAMVAAGLELPGELAPLAGLLESLEEFKDREADEVCWPIPPAPARSILPTLGGAGIPFTSQILTPHTEFSDMALIDLARGCPNHCTFCWIGHSAPAYRIRPIEGILEEVRRLEPHTSRLGLVASAVGRHPEIDALCEELVGRGLKISYSSLRVEEVSETMLRALAAGGQKTVTIAPEAGSRRVRRLLGKRLSDEQIFAATEQIFSLGAENLKLYFMIGIPSESDEEALEIAVFTEKIRQIMLRWARGRGRMGTIAVNLGIFVPKPDLPLLHLEPPVPAAVKKRLKLVLRALERIPNTRTSASSPELARAQGILSMGGVEAARYLLTLRQNGGDWRAANRQWQRAYGEAYAWSRRG